MSIHFILPDLEFDADSPVGYYTCLACEKDGTAWSMFTCNDCNLTFHLRCVLIKPVHPTDPRFNFFVCVDCKCIREVRKKNTRGSQIRRSTRMMSISQMRRKKLWSINPKRTRPLGFRRDNLIYLCFCSFRILFSLNDVSYGLILISIISLNRVL